jgi:dTDP-4-dehydrorhamnose reductase
MKILVAGAGGMLGDAFHDFLGNNDNVMYFDKSVTSDWMVKLDFTHKCEYQELVRNFSPDWIFHIGAETDLEVCEKNEDYAFETNATSVGYAIDIANNLSIPLLYISTAGIFSADKSYFDESDNPTPMGAYSRSKFLGESIVRARAKSYLICRAGWMMGGGPIKDKKFIGKICRQILSGSRELAIVNDKLGTPTYTRDFVAAVFNLISIDARGLFNLVCEGDSSRLEVANYLLECLGLHDSVVINQVSSSHFADEYFAPRPDCEVLRNERLRQLNVNQIRNWRDSMKEYIEKDWLPLFMEKNFE